MTIEKVTDYAAIASYGIASTPGIVIDGKVVHAGGLPRPGRSGEVAEGVIVPRPVEARLTIIPEMSRRHYPGPLNAGACPRSRIAGMRLRGDDPHYFAGEKCPTFGCGSALSLASAASRAPVPSSACAAAMSAFTLLAGTENRLPCANSRIASYFL